MGGLGAEQIQQCMCERDGDVIFDRPRLTRETLLLWFGPLLFLFIGVFVVLRIWRKSAAPSSRETGFDEQTQRKLSQLAAESSRLKD